MSATSSWLHAPGSGRCELVDWLARRDAASPFLCTMLESLLASGQLTAKQEEAVRSARSRIEMRAKRAAAS
jgi:hypothetical protein